MADDGDAVSVIRDLECAARRAESLVAAGIGRGAHLAVVGSDRAAMPSIQEVRQAARVLDGLAAVLRADLNEDQRDDLAGPF